MMIRSARTQILALWNRLIVETSITFTSEEKIIDGLETIILARGKAFQVFEQAGSIFGFAFFSNSDTNQAMYPQWIVRFFYPGAQGSGHGGWLMQLLKIRRANAAGTHCGPLSVAKPPLGWPFIKNLTLK